jgi:hypothetical protein
MGVREQIIFPEVDYDAVDEVRGLDVTITTTAATDIEAFALLLALGMPFAAQGRPAGFEPDGDTAAGPTGARGPAAGAPRGSTRRKPETATIEHEAPAAEREDGAAAEQAEVAAAEREDGAAAEQADVAATEREDGAAAEQAEVAAAEREDGAATEQADVAATEREAPAAVEDESPRGEQEKTNSDVAEEGTD